MKKSLLITLAIIGFFPILTHGATTDSFSTYNGTGFNVSGGVPNYPDSVTWDCEVSDSTCTVFNSTSTYSIVSFTVTGSVGSYWNDFDPIFCNGVPLFSYLRSATNDMVPNNPFTMTWTGPLYCNGYLTVGSNGDPAYFVIQYVPYDIRETQMPLTDTHYVLIQGFFIFLCSMLTVIWIFKRKI